MEKLLLIKGQSGLGNRILSSLCGIVFGLLAKRRIVIDWKDGAYAAPGTNAFPKLFSSPVVDQRDVNLAEISVLPKIWRGRLDWTVSKMIGTFDPKRFSDPTIYRKHCCDLTTLTHEEDLIVYWSYLPKFARISRHFHGEFARFRGMPEHRLIKELMSQFVSLQPYIKSEIDAFALDRFKSPIIGVHVRQSDRSMSLGRLHLDLAKLLAKNTGAAIFLATDNSDVEQDFFNRYLQVIVTKK